MTNNIYPPDHLLRKWEQLIIDEGENVDVVLYEAFQAGADQELDACCEWLQVWFWQHEDLPKKLRATRRPKPPSLKELALEALKHTEEGWRPVPADCAIIRRALESLPD